MAGKTYTERTLDTLVEFSDLHQRRLQEMTEKFDAALGKVTQSIDSLTMQVVQMNVGTKQNSQNIDKLAQTTEKGLDRLTQNIDRLAQIIERQNVAIDNHLRIAELNGKTAEQQAASISELTKLATTQAATVSRLLETIGSRDAR